MLKITFMGEIPSKKNNKIFIPKIKKFVPSARYTAWHSKALQEVRSQWNGIKYNKCKMVFIFTHGDNVRRDSDNGVTSIFDTLVDSNVLEDDRWQVVKEHHVFNFYEKGNARCDVYIYDESEDINLPDLMPELF